MPTYRILPYLTVCSPGSDLVRRCLWRSCGIMRNAGNGSSGLLPGTARWAGPAGVDASDLSGRVAGVVQASLPVWHLACRLGFVGRLPVSVSGAYQAVPCVCQVSARCLQGAYLGGQLGPVLFFADGRPSGLTCV